MVSNKNENINEIISKLVLELTKLKNTEVENTSLQDDDIEVEASPGTPVRIDSRTYYKMIYADVNNLKKDTESLLTLYLHDVKPTLKSVDNNVKKLTEKLNVFEKDITDLKIKQPTTFKNWLEEKGKIAENIGSVGKFVFWTVAILWLLSTALPNIITFITKMSGI